MLGRIGKPARQAVPALEKATNDPDLIVRQSAQAALREILKIRLIADGRLSVR